MSAGGALTGPLRSLMLMAAIDRLVHHATILEFNGDSHRAQSAKTKASA